MQKVSFFKIKINFMTTQETEVRSDESAQNDARQPEKVKSFKEIEEHLQTNLIQIGMEIAEIENFLKLGEELLEKERKLQDGSDTKDEEIIARYKNDIAKLQQGLEMFLSIKEEMENTLAKLHQTKAKADEYIK